MTVLPGPNDRSDPMDQAAAWLFRRDAGPLTAQEETAFAAWRAVSVNAQAFRSLESLWAELGDIPPSRHPTVQETSWPPATQRRWIGIAATVAAVLLVVLGVALDLPLRLQADAMADGSGLLDRVLPDGSMVTLDSGAAIRVDFTDKTRAIRLLRGEALFTVAHDSTRPFVVETGPGRVLALGTRFLVRRLADGASVTVLESRVRVGCDTCAPQGAEVAPGQKVTFGTAGLSAIQAVNAEDEAAWTRGKLIFTERPLGEVVAELDRHFQGHVLLWGDGLAQRRISGVFSIAPVDQAFEGLRTSLHLRALQLSPWLVILTE